MDLGVAGGLGVKVDHVGLVPGVRPPLQEEGRVHLSRVAAAELAEEVPVRDF
jgi:hypothetical protein